jgi:uncharacterized protein YciI
MGVIPEGWTLFVVDLEYIVPMEQVETVLGPHCDFLDRAYAEGRFIASGRKVPRTGGVILLAAPSLQDAQDYMSADPFMVENIARYTFTEFVPSAVHEALR